MRPRKTIPRMKRCIVEIEPIRDDDIAPPPPKRAPGGPRKTAQDDDEAQKEGVT